MKNQNLWSPRRKIFLTLLDVQNIITSSILRVTYY